MFRVFRQFEELNLILTDNSFTVGGVKQGSREVECWGRRGLAENGTHIGHYNKVKSDQHGKKHLEIVENSAYIEKCRACPIRCPSSNGTVPGVLTINSELFLFFSFLLTSNQLRCYIRLHISNIATSQTVTIRKYPFWVSILLFYLPPSDRYNTSEQQQCPVCGGVCSLYF